jgi:hypothetical protein
MAIMWDNSVALHVTVAATIRRTLDKPTDASKNVRNKVMVFQGIGHHTLAAGDGTLKVYRQPAGTAPIEVWSYTLTASSTLETAFPIGEMRQPIVGEIGEKLVCVLNVVAPAAMTTRMVQVQYKSVQVT